MNRIIRRCLLDTPLLPSTTLPPTFLLPSRARYFNSTTPTIASPPEDASQATRMPTFASVSAPSNPTRLAKLPAKPELSTPLTLSASTRHLLPLLAAQASHYISAHIHGRPYLLTRGDSVRLPFHMKNVVPGDVLRLNRATAVGSRDYTLRAAAGATYLDERLFECRATVLGVEAAPLTTTLKTKRRQRKTKVVKTKHRFTLLRVSELRLRSLGELEREAAA